MTKDRPEVAVVHSNQKIDSKFPLKQKPPNKP
jgi:hypothetical protein